MKFSTGILVATVLTLGIAPIAYAQPPLPQVGTNILTDGNFTGTLGSDGWNAYQASCMSNCETVTYNTSSGLGSAPFSGALTPTSTANAPSSFAVFNANGGATGAYLEQKFTSFAGVNYLMSYKYVPFGTSSSQFSLFTEIVDTTNHTLVVSTPTSATPALDAGVLESVMLSFVGNGDQYALIIEDNSPSGQTQLPLIANASVTNIPEPISMGLLGSALLGMGFVRRSRRV